MSKIRNALNRIEKTLYTIQSDSKHKVFASKMQSPILVGGCIFNVPGIDKIYYSGYFSDECESFGGEFVYRECNPLTEFCYRGAVENEAAQASDKTKSDISPPGCKPRYPGQKEITDPWAPIPVVGGGPTTTPTRSLWWGGGNDCGDPYIGWHPMCKIYFENPVNKYSKLKGENGKIKLRNCQDDQGNPISVPEGEVPIPLIEIVIDTRGLAITENPWPLPGTHVVPGPLGPPMDGGIWRGFRPVAVFPNPEYLKYISENHPQCMRSICEGSLAEFFPGTTATSSAPINGLLLHRCSIVRAGLCREDERFESFFKRNFPMWVSGGENVFQCEQAICGLVNKYLEAIEQGEDNIYPWNQNFGPEPFAPNIMCPILTGHGNLNPVQEEIRSKCSGSMDFLANLFNKSKPSYRNPPMSAANPFGNDPQGLRDGCFNCLVWLNPNNLEWLPSDFAWPKTQEDQLDVILKLVESGASIDWICAQGCMFGSLCNIGPPQP